MTLQELLRRVEELDKVPSATIEESANNIIEQNNLTRLLAKIAAERAKGILAERERAQGLALALERVLYNFKLILASKPVRDATETIAEAESALAAPQNSEEP